MPIRNTVRQLSSSIHQSWAKIFLVCNFNSVCLCFQKLPFTWAKMIHEGRLRPKEDGLKWHSCLQGWRVVRILGLCGLLVLQAACSLQCFLPVHCPISLAASVGQLHMLGGSLCHMSLMFGNLYIVLLW